MTVESQRDLCERISAAGCGIHVIALAPENGCDEAKDRRVIIDYQDSVGGHAVSGRLNRAKRIDFNAQAVQS